MGECVEPIVGIQTLSGVDCAAAFDGRLTGIIVMTASFAVYFVIGTARGLWQGNAHERKALMLFSAVTVGICSLIGAFPYFGLAFSEGRRQTLSEDGVRSLALDGTDLVARYCQGQTVREARIPLSRISGWAFYVQENRSSVSIRLRFRLTHPNGRVEWPEYRAGLMAFSNVGSSALARLAPEVARGIEDVARTHPRRDLR
jgi:hypothetical protein